RQLLQFADDAAQSGQARYVDPELHARLHALLVGAGLGAVDAHLLVGQHAAYVAQQALAVVRLQDQFDGVILVCRVQPVDFYDAFRMPAVETAKVLAAAAMDTDAAALGDVSDDALRRYGTAAAREGAQQVADAADLDLLVARALAPRSALCR